MTPRVSYPSKWPLILALDDSPQDAELWRSRLKDEIWGFKIGSILFAQAGPAILEEFCSKGQKVFLDLKFHDIPNTVEKSVKRAFEMGVDFVTVHACGGRAMLESAAQHQKGEQKILAVTVLTSLEARDLSDLGISRSVDDQVKSLATLAVTSGIKGLVCSPLEVAELRKVCPQATLVTPGVRTGPATQDQKRVATLREVFAAGADLAVLGRALTAADDWRQAWTEIKSSMEDIFSKKP